MRIQVTQTNLNKALAILSRVASSKTPLPILANILFKANKGSLELAATNLEVAISHITKGKIEETGSVTVPARLLYDFVSQLPKEEIVNLVFEKSKLFIQAGSYSSHLQGTSSEDFPALPKVKDGISAEVELEGFKKALNRTMLAASHDETRPILGGVYFQVADGKLTCAATDGYRLAEAELGKCGEAISAVVPLSSLQDVLRIIQDGTEPKLSLKFDDGQFGITYEGTELVSRLVDGQYPEYRQLIPKSSDISFTTNRESLITAAKLAGLFARESGGSITLRASESGKNVVVSSVASQVGDNTSTIESTVEGSGEVVLNVRYLVDALNCFDSETINFRFSGSVSPCVLTSSDQPGYQHIVMPLKS